jgi:hypothetical protein
MGSFVTDFMTFSDQMNGIITQMNVIRDQLRQVLNEQRKDLLGQPDHKWWVINQLLEYNNFIQNP